MIIKASIDKYVVHSIKTSIVISQPMYFPWVGTLEQVKLSDIFVHYEDVQFSRGSFFNRVQVKTEAGVRWLTVPLKNHILGQKINEVEVDYRTDWRKSHLDVIKRAYLKAEYQKDMLELIDDIFSHRYHYLSELSKASMMSLIRYFGLENRIFIDSSNLSVTGSGTKRVVDICTTLNATNYITGHGARNYLKHELFEERGIDVNYINYGLASYRQLHGLFTPYVTALDLIANCGKDGINNILGALIPWRQFITVSKEN